MNQRSGNGSRFSQSIPVIKVSRSQSNNNPSTKANNNNNNTNGFFARFNRNQSTNLNPKSKTSNGRSNIRKKSVTPIDHQDYFSSTQKLGPSRQSWQSLSQVVHDLASKCFVSITNPQLLTEFLHAESQLSDFFRLSKMVFNNARPTRGNPRRVSQTSHQPRPPNEPSKRSSSARRRIRSNSNNSNTSNSTATTEPVNSENPPESDPPKSISETSPNRPAGSDLRPTHAVSKLGLQFIEQWDSFLGEFNNVSLRGISPLNSLISDRLLFISHFMKNTVSQFFAAPQANVPIGAMNHAYSVALTISRKARRLHLRENDYSRGVLQLENSIFVFFGRVVPHPMSYTNSIQCARKDLLIQMNEIRQMVYGVSIFESVIESVRILMDEVNKKFNDLFTDLNLPYRIVASYEDDGVNDRKAVSEVKNSEVVIEEEEEGDDDDDDDVVEEEEEDDFDYRQKLKDKETVEHLDKIRSNIEKIEEALALGQKMIRKKKK